MNSRKFLILRIVLIVLSIFSLICIEIYQKKVIEEEQRVIEEEKNELNENILIDAAKLYISNKQDYYAELLKIKNFEIRINTEDLVKNKLIKNNDNFKGYIKVLDNEYSFVNKNNMIINKINSKDYNTNSNNENDAYDLKYIYTGKNPNNYVKYKDKTYRIIGITNSDNLKLIMTENSLDEVWGLSGDINYLKTDNDLEEEGYKGIFYVGYVRSETNDISTILKNEKRNNTYTVNQPKYIGTYSYVNISDIVNASDECKFNKILDINKENCDSYLINMLTNTYTSIALENNMVYKVDEDNKVTSSKISKDFNYKKVLYVSGYEEYISGNGSLENPYEIR